MPLDPVYFWGYRGHTLAALQALQATTQALIVDARYLPYSRAPEWQRANLAAIFGANYHHLPALGNRNYRAAAGPIAIVDLAAGVAFLRQVGRPVIVLCACPVALGCHTTVIRDALVSHGVPVVELRASLF